MRKAIYNHTSFETAYEVKNYPYGRLRTSMFYWIETTPKKGDRFCSRTICPKTGRLNAPKKSTYYSLMAMFLDENNHVKFTALNIYSKPETIDAFIEWYGMDNLNADQRIMYNQLKGINPVKIDEFTGVKKKDYSVKWERETIGAGWKDGKYHSGEPGNYREVKITFDRPDGVKLIEIFKAMKSLNQEKLSEVFEVRDHGAFGSFPGVVRICCRGGVYLGEVSEDSYKEWLASDENVMQEEEA